MTGTVSGKTDPDPSGTFSGDREYEGRRYGGGPKGEAEAWRQIIQKIRVLRYKERADMKSSRRADLFHRIRTEQFLKNHSR